MAVLNRETDAVQNPAFGAMLLWRSCVGYHKASTTAAPMPLPLFFLVLPICLHRETAEFLASTNTQSGLRKLVEKFHLSSNGKTDLVLAIANRAHEMKPLTMQSLQIATSSSLVALNIPTAGLFPLSTVNPTVGIAASIRPSLRGAEKLGNWFAQITLFEIQMLLHVRL